jgi:hypothetical protein
MALLSLAGMGMCAAAASREKVRVSIFSSGKKASLIHTTNKSSIG